MSLVLVIKTSKGAWESKKGVCICQRKVFDGCDLAYSLVLCVLYPSANFHSHEGQVVLKCSANRQCHETNGQQNSANKPAILNNREIELVQLIQLRNDSHEEEGNEKCNKYRVWFEKTPKETG